MTSRRRAPWQLPLREVNQESAPWAYHVVARFARLFIPLMTKRIWSGREHIPATGGALVVSNHLSNYDTVSLGEYLIWAGRWPRFLGKSDIWKVPILRYFATQCRQIPVYRNTPNAKQALVHAEEALANGDLVAIYPEGTITRDPDEWPMTARLGAARLALKHGIPVIPVAQLGTSAVLGGSRLRLHRMFSLRRRPILTKAAPPMDFSKFKIDGEPTKQQLEQASVEIMDRLTELVAELRGEEPPQGRFDLRVGARVPQLAA